MEALREQQETGKGDGSVEEGAVLDVRLENGVGLVSSIHTTVDGFSLANTGILENGSVQHPGFTIPLHLPPKPSKHTSLLCSTPPPTRTTAVAATNQP